MINIYCYQNKINGKIYIGQTSYSLEERFNRKYYNSINFNRALKKYGIHNFDRWIFAIMDTVEQADQEERYWITEMRKQLGKENVYNIADGGRNGRLGKKASKETKQKQSVWQKGKPKPWMHYQRNGLKYGASHKNKTWKLINGKRVWMEK